MNFLSDINPVSLVTNGHSQEFNDPLHCILHSFECNLEVIGGLRHLGVGPYGLPHPFELPTHQRGRSQVVFDEYVHRLKGIVLLI